MEEGAPRLQAQRHLLKLLMQPVATLAADKNASEAKFEGNKIDQLGGACGAKQRLAAHPLPNDMVSAGRYVEFFLARRRLHGYLGIVGLGALSR